MLTTDIFKNKFFVTASSISVAILVLVLVLSPKKNQSENLLTPPSNSPTPQSFQLLNLSQEKIDTSKLYLTSIEKKLPLSLEKFPTSVGILTGINIYRAKNDPPEMVRLEISGLSYANKNEINEIKNPNVTAFKESYLKALEMIESQNIDPKKLIFYYGNQAYIRQTAREWVDKLKLAP